MCFLTHLNILGHVKKRYIRFIEADWNARRFLLYRFLFGLFGIILGAPLVIVLFFLQPFVPIKLGILKYERIGHLIANTEFWLRSRCYQENKNRGIIIFFCGRPLANRQILNMIKRKVFVIENTLLTEWVKILKKYYSFAPWIRLDNSGFNSWEIWNSVGPQLNFTEEEEKKGREILKYIGIPEGDSFICFHARENLYLKKHINSSLPIDWSYQDYRDSSIENYISAVEYMASKGIWALRMGSAVSKPVVSNNYRIIDYANKFRSDFADVYLMSHCKFFIGDTSGIFMLASAFNVPFVQVNLVPLIFPARAPFDLFIPKKYWHIRFKRFLTFREIFRMGADRWTRTEQFKKAEIELVENTPEEILGVVEEMNDRLDGVWVPEDEDEHLQAQFRRLFPLDNPAVGFPSRIGAKFLRENRELLL